MGSFVRQMIGGLWDVGRRQNSCPPRARCEVMSPRAGGHLVVAIWPGCFRLAASVLGDRSLAEDAAQEACAIVYRKVRGLRNADAFDAWLYRIVMREAAKIRRKSILF